MSAVGIRAAAGVALALAVGLAVGWVIRRFNDQREAVVVTGTVEARQVDVSARLTGRVVELRAREGQPVERGQLLVVMDDRDLRPEVGRAEATLAAARARLRDLLAGARPEELREAEARLAQAEARLSDLLAGSRPQEVEAARAAVRQAAAARALAERELARVQELFARELVAAQELDRARQAYESAAAQEQAAYQRLALVEAGPRPHEVEAARAEVRAARERLALLRAGPRPEEVAAARAQVAEAEGVLEAARARLAETRLYAPLTGVVLRQNVEPGETVTPGLPLLTLVDPTDLWIRVYVPETDIGRVRLGQRAHVTVDSYPGRVFPGTVTEIAGEAEFTPKNVQTRKERVNLVFRIKIAVRDREGILKPGMPADAALLP